MKCLVISLILVITGCRQQNKAQPDQEWYCTIKTITESQKLTVLEIDTLQYLTGDTAIHAAALRREADTFFTEDGKMHVDIPNDIYIINDVEDRLSYKISKNLTIDLSAIVSEQKISNSLQSLKEVYSDNIFKVKIHQNEIQQIKAIFTP